MKTYIATIIFPLKDSEEPIKYLANSVKNAKVHTVEEVKTRKEALEFIRDLGGKIFSVKFIKRTSGELREMVCRQGVKRDLAENPTKPGVDFKANELIPVFDMKADAYRSIPIEGIRDIKIDGNWYKVV